MSIWPNWSLDLTRLTYNPAFSSLLLSVYRGERDVMLSDKDGGTDVTSDKMAAVEGVIERLRKDKRVVSQQLRRVDRDLKPASDKTYEHKVTLT